MIFSASPTISIPTVAVITTAEPNPPQFRWVWQRLLVSFGGSSEYTQRNPNFSLWLVPMPFSRNFERNLANSGS